MKPRTIDRVLIIILAVLPALAAGADSLWTPVSASTYVPAILPILVILIVRSGNPKNDSRQAIILLSLGIAYLAAGFIFSITLPGQTLLIVGAVLVYIGYFKRLGMATHDARKIVLGFIGLSVAFLGLRLVLGEFLFVDNQLLGPVMVIAGIIISIAPYRI
ncbi:MAG: hypothetical protein HY367_03045 [Candidatus Aenigmarchaeota archaeon]|nr:hypothetical protein [Candidatus Aenigmarchaeota archaeon]